MECDKKLHGFDAGSAWLREKTMEFGNGDRFIVVPIVTIGMEAFVAAMIDRKIEVDKTIARLSALTGIPYKSLEMSLKDISAARINDISEMVALGCSIGEWPNALADMKDSCLNAANSLSGLNRALRDIAKQADEPKKPKKNALGFLDGLGKYSKRKMK